MKKRIVEDGKNKNDKSEVKILTQQISSTFLQPGRCDLYLAQDIKEIDATKIDNNSIILVGGAARRIAYFVIDRKLIKKKSGILASEINLSAEQEKICGTQQLGKLNRTLENSGWIDALIDQARLNMGYPPLIISEEQIKELKKNHKFKEDYDLFGQLNCLYKNIPLFKGVSIPDLPEKKKAFKKLGKLVNHLINFLGDLPLQIKQDVAAVTRNFQLFPQLDKCLRAVNVGCYYEESKISGLDIKIYSPKYEEEYQEILTNWQHFEHINKLLFILQPNQTIWEAYWYTNFNNEEKTRVKEGSLIEKELNRAMRENKYCPNTEKIKTIIRGELNIQIERPVNIKAFKEVLKKWKELKHINKALFILDPTEKSWSSYWGENSKEPIKIKIKKRSAYQTQLNNPIPDPKNIMKVWRKESALFENKLITERVGIGGQKFEYTKRVIITGLLSIFTAGTGLEPKVYRKESGLYAGNFYNFLEDLAPFIKYSDSYNIGEVAMQVVDRYKKNQTTNILLATTV